MSTAESDSEEFNTYRRYLHSLALDHVPKSYLGRLERSDIVQQTLLQAYVAREQFRGHTEAQRLAWLRQILIRNVTHAKRGLHTRKRDINRERSLECVACSTSRSIGLPAVDQSTPSGYVLRQERIRIVTEAMRRLPDEQREILILRYRDHCSIDELARTLGKSASAIASVLHRAKKNLREGLEKASISGLSSGGK